MKCCNCSREIPENSLYCNWCGKKQLREKEKKLKIPAPRQLPSGSWTVQLRREGVNVTEPDFWKRKKRFRVSRFPSFSVSIWKIVLCSPHPRGEAMRATSATPLWNI